MMNKFIVLILCLVLNAPVQATADMVVIMNQDSGVDKLSRQELVNIYMGRYRKLPDDTVAEPLDIEGGGSENGYFYSHLLGKTLAEINAYWARLIFSGKTTPPEVLLSQKAVLDRVLHDKSAIGYVDRQMLNGKVKAVYEFRD